MHENRGQGVVELDFKFRISNLEKNVAFMASTSMLILAAMITVIANTDQVTQLFSTLPFFSETNAQLIQFKFFLLCLIFIYAFFTFTWSLRQFGFCGVLIGAAPNAVEKNISNEECRVFSLHCGKILDQASHSYNFGLRSFYYSLAMLAWFLHPLLFMLATATVVAILYQREFRSKSLQLFLSLKVCMFLSLFLFIFHILISLLKLLISLNPRKKKTFYM